MSGGHTPKLLSIFLFCFVFAGCGGGNAGGGGGPKGPPPVGNPFWAQWGANPQHTGAVNVAGQMPNRIAADMVYDPFVAQEQADADLPGALLVHYQTPLTAGDDVFMEFKTGKWVPCNPPGSRMPFPCGPDAWNQQIWNEKRLHWSNGRLSEIWNFQSDWKPEPEAHGVGAEPVFHPAMVKGLIYVPGFGGSVWKVNATDGSVVTHIQPFGATVDPNTFVAGPLSADQQGNVYYHAIQLSNPSVANPWLEADVVGAWLVRIAADDSAKTAAFSSLFGASVVLPTTCVGAFSLATDPLPWPPSPDAHPPQGPCGSQRPGLNVAPAIAPDGTVYTVSRAHFNDRYAYLVAVNPDLTPKWAASLRGNLADGCGVLVPFGTAAKKNICRSGTATGVDPATNDLPAGRVNNSSTSSPTVLPDGNVIFGVATIYNGGRGHLFKFSPAVLFQGSFDFGWDSTVTVYPHGNSYSIINKDNHYDGTFYITQLDPNLQPEWQFLDTNVAEWCVNASVVDSNGVVYANSEDGNLYAIGQGNSGVFSTPVGKVFLRLAPGAAYTPLSLGPDGKVYTQVAGHLFVATQ
jgi:outer membrane protein assembly factor BamB